MEDPNGLIYNHQGKSFHAATSKRVSLFPEYRFCAVTRLSHFLQALRVLFPLRFFGKNISLESDKPHSKVQMIITAAMHIYFLCVFGNLVFYTLEIVMGFASVEPDPKLITLRNVIYNSRYGIMVIKSALLLLAFRWNSVDIYKISRQVSLEFEMAPEEMRITVAKVSILLLVVLALVSIGWEVMDFYSWETDFLSTWRKEVFLALTGEHVPMWKLWIPWYILATPMNFVMNVAMIFYASIILTIYLSWKKMNKDLWREKDYVWNKFEEDFERLRFSAEFVDDMLSVTVFVAWVCDIACAIGYVGSVVIYGAGSRTEQVYTLSGIFIHAVWSPACYLVPCILYQEQMYRTQRLVFSAISRYPWQECENFYNEKGDKESGNGYMRTAVILQKGAYKPGVFTAWKFFGINRNVILTIATVLFSYALLLVQLVGRKHDTQEVVNLINEKVNYTHVIS